MSDIIDFEPARDHHHRDVPLEHGADIPVLGIPVRYRSNAREPVRVAEEAFAAWRGRDVAPGGAGESPVTVRIVVHEGDEGVAEHAPVRHRMLDGHRFLLHTPGSVAFVDPSRQEAVGFVTPGLVTDREHFRYAVVEAMTMGLITPLDRQPLHAAAVVDEEGRALLLAGRSGVGKSTLTWAAVRGGLRVLSEDTVFLQSRPTLRVWGLPGFLHLPADAARRFPELEGERTTLLASGKRKLVVDLARRDALAEPPVAERVGVCVLERGGGGDGDGPERMDAAALLERLTSEPEPGFDLFADTVKEPLADLAAGGGWRLALPPDPTRTVPHLRAMLERIGEDEPR